MRIMLLMWTFRGRELLVYRAMLLVLRNVTSLKASFS